MTQRTYLRRSIILWMRRYMPFIINPAMKLYSVYLKRLHRSLLRDVIAEYGGVVQVGPFAGLRFSDANDFRDFAHLPAAQLLGIYEAELHAIWQHIIDDETITTLVNVGSAAGYYAVGFALRKSSARVDAYDLDPKARTLTRRNAEANQVDDRVRIHELADFATLRSVLTAPRQTLIFIDCEGCEADLLNPDEVPPLRECTMLIEVHDFAQPGSGEKLLTYFSDTHTHTIIHPQKRDPNAYPETGFLKSRMKRYYAVYEHRQPGLYWLFLEPRTNVTK
ncbi:MAG: hypothetical protein D6737_17945 [Chloroflexi bacterium]|nr:MAG: hypothetical protein D6737_17945 [Chloroflexota bacterium]